jgi:hypothetical protein
LCLGSLRHSSAQYLTSTSSSKKSQLGLAVTPLGKSAVLVIGFSRESGKRQVSRSVD